MSQTTQRKAFTDRRTLIALGGAVAALLPVTGGAFATDRHSHAVAATTPTGSNVRTYKESQTAAALRDLWIGHIFWIRTVSTAMIDKNDSAMTVAEKQVVANAETIAGSIEPFYGAAAKEAFFKLLAGHYGAVKAYLIATVSGNSSALNTAVQSLTSNAEEIATFLSKANPYLPKDKLQGLLLAHGGHHIQQIQQLKDRQYQAEAKTWEEMKAHIYQIADATAGALAKQFNKRFT